MDFIWSVLGFVILLGVLVTIHEWGHFVVARFFNVKVLTFSVGFGKSLFSYKKGETEYRLAAIPLGGYVKFLDERVEEVAPEEKSRAFNNLSVYKRFAIVVAGPLVNLIFAWLVFAIVYFVGVTSLKPIFYFEDSSSALAKSLGEEALGERWEVVELGDSKVASWQELQQQVLSGLVSDKKSLPLVVQRFDSLTTPTHRTNLSLEKLDINDLKGSWLSQLGFIPYQPLLVPILGKVEASSAAAKAGLEAGDKIVSLDSMAVDSWQDLVKFVHLHPGKRVGVGFVRDGQTLAVDVVLDEQEFNGKNIGRLGVAVQQQKLDDRFLSVSSAGVGSSLILGWQQMVKMVDMTITMLKKMLFGQVGLQHLSGPISIAEFSGTALQSGIISFLSLMALISLSLGILNLLPIPMLDGGHLMFYLYEMLRGKPVSEAVEQAGFKIGILLIAGLSFLAIGNDLLRITYG